MAFISVTRSNGYRYIYLKRYIPPQEFSEKNHEYVYSFGRYEKALPMLKKWYKHFDILFPEELKEKGFTREDLREWIQRIEEKGQYRVVN